MVFLHRCCEACDHRGLDGDHEAEGDRRRTLWGRSVSGGRRRPAFLLRDAKPDRWRSGGGKKPAAAVAARRSRLKPSFGQIAPIRGLEWSDRPTVGSGKKTGQGIGLPECRLTGCGAEHGNEAAAQMTVALGPGLRNDPTPVAAESIGIDRHALAWKVP
jgi:hypothetical protein